MKSLLSTLILLGMLSACKSAPVYTPLIVLKLTQPIFPEAAIERGETGSVIVRGWVDETGTIKHVEIRQSSGSKRLDKAALNAAQKTQFKPATLNGKPVKATFTRPYIFKFKNTDTDVKPSLITSESPS